MTFTYNYSAARNKEVEEIRNKYIVNEKSKINELRWLDNAVQSAGLHSSLTAGIAGMLIFGLAMCFFLGALPGGLAAGIPAAVIGGAFMIAAYPIYSQSVKNARSQYVPRILELLDELEKQ